MTGCGGDGEAEPEPKITIRGLVGEFDPGERFYVAECRDDTTSVEVDYPDPVSVAGKPPRAGRFSAEVPVQPGTDFRISVRPENGAERGYIVRCLPADFPYWSFQEVSPAPPGLFAVTIPGEVRSPWVVIFDEKGIPRWWYRTERNVLGAQILSDGTIAWARSFGDGYGINPGMAHEIRTLDGRLVRLVRTVGSITDAHEFYELPNGHVLVDSYKPEGPVDLRLYDLPAQQGPRNGYVVYGEAQELDENGRLVWRWNSGDHVGLDEVPLRWQDSVVANDKPSPNGAGTHDVFHLNSIEPWGPDRLIISGRHVDAAFGIDRDTGEVEWKLGGTPTPESLEIIGDPAGDLTFGGQHDVRINDEGILSVFDNSKDRPRPPRVVRYRIDLEERTATYIGEMTDPALPLSHCCGSARELEDGGWLVYWGDTSLVTQFDAEGEIQFRLVVRGPPFRAMPVPEGTVDVSDLNRAMERMEPPPD